MVDFKARIYDGDNNQMIGAEVTVYSESGDRLGSIQITSKKDFDDLVDRLDGLDERYVLKSNLQNDLNNLTINAQTLDGLSSSDFASSGHNHDNRYPVNNHASNNQMYGLGSNSLYGHVKLVDDLNKSSYSDGEALSAHQGKVLDDKISSIIASNTRWTKVVDKTYLTVYHNSSIRMCYAKYNREAYTGFKSVVNENFLLHSENTIPSSYQPITRVVSSLYRGDVTIWINTDGSIGARSLVKLNSTNINCSFIWLTIV